VFANSNVRSVSDYPGKLLDMLQHLAPSHMSNPEVVVMTPGILQLRLLRTFVPRPADGCGTGRGPRPGGARWICPHAHHERLQKVDVIYRRIDDDFMDPLAFRPDSALGVPGLMEVYRAGRVALANAPGTGVADDKVVYAYVPKMIKYYLNEDAILPNVPTYLCWIDEDRQHVLKNLDKLVVKAANESGGYGMLVGPHATVAEREKFAELIKASPRQLHRPTNPRPVPGAGSRR
jgi:uncharacterized circularly permuted ATP-grasp superfamily protein